MFGIRVVKHIKRSVTLKRQSILRQPMLVPIVFPVATRTAVVLRVGFSLCDHFVPCHFLLLIFEFLRSVQIAPNCVSHEKYESQNQQTENHVYESVHGLLAFLLSTAIARIQMSKEHQLQCYHRLPNGCADKLHSRGVRFSMLLLTLLKREFECGSVSGIIGKNLLIKFPTLLATIISSEFDKSIQFKWVCYLSDHINLIMQAEMYDRTDSLMSDEESEKLEIFVSCRKLADLDFLTVTDSFLIIRMMEPNKPPREILRTKVYENDLNPHYAESVIIDYFFEIRQKLLFEVYHYDKPPKLVGRMESTVGEVFGSPSNGLKKPLMNKNGKEAGEIIVRIQKVHKMTNKQITMNVWARNLPEYTSFCFFGGTSPFFRIFRKREKDELLVYQSETKELTSDPHFKQVTLSERKLCRNNEQMPFEVRFYNYSSTGAHKLIGTAKPKVFELEKKGHFDILDSKGKMKGVCAFSNVKRTTKYQFGDYISANLELALITCIDFTGSNGIQRDPNSLHHITANKMSPYEEALYEVSKILLDYDADKLVPVYGFGAKVNMPTYQTMNKVHHCFPLNGQQTNANVFQVEGIMKAYRQALPYLQFGGPTYFSRLLGEAINEARAFQQFNNQYMIMFILTDGEIHDKQQVIDQIIECCSLPISLIIVGVGSGDFGIMDELDDDDCNLVDSKGRKTTRDLVQFVEFRKFKNNGIELAREVLEELPRQVEEYYQMMGLSPQSIANAKVNQEIRQEAQNYHRPTGVQPTHANMNGSLQRQATWEEIYFKQNTMNMPPPPNYRQ